MEGYRQPHGGVGNILVTLQGRIDTVSETKRSQCVSRSLYDGRRGGHNRLSGRVSSGVGALIGRHPFLAWRPANGGCNRACSCRQTTQAAGVAESARD